jgi:hypothetical protein
MTRLIERRSGGRTAASKGALLFFSAQRSVFACEASDVTNVSAQTGHNQLPTPPVNASRAASRQYLAHDSGVSVDRYSFTATDFHHILLASLPAHSLGFRPVHSRCHQFATR